MVVVVKGKELHQQRKLRMETEGGGVVRGKRLRRTDDPANEGSRKPRSGNKANKRMHP